MWTSVNPSIPLVFFLLIRSSAAGSLLPAMANLHAGGCGVSPEGPERSEGAAKRLYTSRSAAFLQLRATAHLTPIRKARGHCRMSRFLSVPASRSVTKYPFGTCGGMRVLPFFVRRLSRPQWGRSTVH